MSVNPSPAQQARPHQDLSLATLAAHAGVPRKASLHSNIIEGKHAHRPPQNAHVTPLFQTTVFDFDSIGSASEAMKRGAYEYGRVGLPNPHELGTAVAVLEGAEAGVATSTGMGAISAAMLATLSAGDIVIAQYNVYGGTIEFLEHDLPRYGVTVHFEDTSNLHRLEELLSDISESEFVKVPKVTAELSPGGKSIEGKGEGSGVAGLNPGFLGPRLGSQAEGAPANGGSFRGRAVPAVTERPRKVVIVVETVSNPLLVVTNIRPIAELAKRAGAVLMVDNTFGTPLRSQPLSEGADLVIHSATKFLGGHHDLLAGAVVGAAELVRPIEAHPDAPGPDGEEWATAAVLGRRLEKDPRVTGTTWHEKVALVTFEVVGGLPAAEAASQALKLIMVTASLGGVTTTISHPATSSHASITAEQRNELGIRDGHLRISVGLEDPEDLWADLDRGLATAAVSKA